MKLYKYYSPQEYNFDAVENKKLWISANKKLNDPYDLYSGRIMLQSNFSKSRTFKHKLTSAVSALNKEFRLYDSLFQYIEQFATCSFTRSCINRLMWAHYADSFKGFCVGYELDDYKFTSDNKWQNVTYVDQIPEGIIENKKNNKSNEALFKSIVESISHIKEGPFFSEIDEWIYKLLSYKAYAWCYEQEVRYIGQLGFHQEGALIDLPSNMKLSEIIIGSDFDFNNLCRIEEIAEDNNMQILELDLNNSQYFALDIKAYDRKEYYKKYRKFMEGR